MHKLNLGCGSNLVAGYVNVDKYGSFSPDVVWDLEQFPWPFDDNSAGEILLNHSLEHMGASVEGFLSIMKELYRVAAPGAVVSINVPHPRSDGFLGDPTHVRPITPAVMSLFSMKKNREWKELEWPNTPLATYLGIDFDLTNVVFNIGPAWMEKFNSGKITQEELLFAMDSYWNVVQEIKITLTAVK